MELATHVYAYRVTTSRPFGRAGRHLTGRFQTVGEVTIPQAKEIISMLAHGALGDFEVTELVLVSSTGGK